MFEKEKDAIIQNFNALLIERGWRRQDLSVQMRNPKGGFRLKGFVSDTLNRPGLPPSEFLFEAARVFQVDVSLLVSNYFETFAQKLAKNIVADSIQSIFKGPIGLLRLVEWHAHYGGKLVEWESWKEHVDIYGEPTQDDMPINLHRMGKDSLAAKTAGVFQPAAVRRKLETAPKHFVEGVASSHSEVISKNEPIFDVIDMDITLTNGQRVRKCFGRLQLPIEFPNASKGVMTVAKQLPLGAGAVSVEQMGLTEKQARIVR